MTSATENGERKTRRFDPVLVLHQVLAICGVAVLVDEEDAVALVDQFGLEETIGPLLDPTAYMRTADKCANAKRAAKAFLAFRQAMQGVQIAEADRLASIMALSESTAQGNP